jgi:predicted regulator of Ras-like GTPase activity (Roadblock/LC7/MglB family)
VERGAWLWQNACAEGGVDHVTGLVGRLHQARNVIHGCESLSVASSDGLILATTHDEMRQGEFLAAVTSLLLTSATKGLSPFKAGDCRALDFRGDRQVLMVRVEGISAYLVCVLHPGATAVNLDAPALRNAIAAVPNILRAQEVDRTRRYLLQRDKTLRVPIKQGRFLVGRAPHCDIVLASSKVAAEHLSVEVVKGNLLATDLETTHGTKLNGRTIEGTVEVQIGDRFTFPKSASLLVAALDAEGRELGPDGQPVATKDSGKRARERSSPI